MRVSLSAIGKASGRVGPGVRRRRRSRRIRIRTRKPIEWKNNANAIVLHSGGLTSERTSERPLQLNARVAYQKVACQKVSSFARSAHLSCAEPFKLACPTAQLATARARNSSPFYTRHLRQLLSLLPPPLRLRSFKSTFDPLDLNLKLSS